MSLIQGVPSYHDSDCRDDSAFRSRHALQPVSSERIEHIQRKSFRNRDDAFALLMTSVKEKEVWKEVDVIGDRTFRTNGGSAQRKAPFYKFLQGMPIAVDAFCYGAIPDVKAYFLS